MAVNSSALVPLAVPVYKKIVSLFPKDYFRFCFAYGSGVLKQGGGSVEKTPMIDMVFVVDDSEGFHSENMHMNPHHYSFLKYTGHNFVTFVQKKLPAKIYYNTLIPFEEDGVMYKYGIVDRIHLIDDLLDWDYLYLAGRLQKPVKFIVEPPNDVSSALRINLCSALHAALIMLPQIFSERDLYEVIANFSYNGDFRMIFGEDKNKVSNIVDNQMAEFRKIYLPIIKSLDDYLEISDGDSPNQTCIQDASPRSKMYHLFRLPKIPQKLIIRYWRFHVSWNRKDVEDVMTNIANNPDLSDILSNCLRNVVLRSSIEQSFKGIFTAGLWKSLEYSKKKINKMMKAGDNY